MAKPTRRGLATFLGILALLALTIAVWLLVFTRAAPGSSSAAASGTGGAAGPTVTAPTPATSTVGVPTDTSSPSGEPTVHSTPPTRLAVFLGDGAVQGLTDGDAVTGRWTTTVAQRQGWAEDNLGRAGTGYAATPADPATCWLASCPAVSELVADAVAARPNVVVICAGAADVDLLASDRAAVHRAIHRTYRTLTDGLPGTRVIAMSSLWTGPGEPPAGLATIDGWVKSAAVRYHADYVPGGTTWLARTPDATVGGELTTSGHARIAAVLDRWLKRNS